MKRSAALAPLSRDHHRALVLARELARAGPDQTGPAAERFVRFLSEHELSHFALEESVLLPALPDGEPGQSLSRRVHEDHAWLRAAVRRLREFPADATIDTVHEIGTRLRSHVNLEERELFPYLERALDPAALEQLGARLAAEPDGDPAAVARRFLSAFIDRDREALLAIADPQIELHPLRLTGARAYLGHDGIRKWLADLERSPVQPRFELHAIERLDSEHARANVRLLLDGEERAAVVALITVRGARVSEVHGYFSDEQLLAHLGIL